MNRRDVFDAALDFALEVDLGEFGRDDRDHIFDVDLTLIATNQELSLEFLRYVGFEGSETRDPPAPASSNTQPSRCASGT